MRVALVSPYSWTYPGGVNRHVEALAGEVAGAGHEVRVFAPFDRDDRRARLLHGGARPLARERPDWLVPLGPTFGWAANGAVSNLALTPSAVSATRRALREFGPDVVHVHEPVAPVVGYDVLASIRAPLVGTFHCYSDNAFTHGIAQLMGARRRLGRLHVRIAVSEAAAWTGARFWGGEYRIVPNGVALPPEGVPAPRRREAGDPLRVAFVGQAVARKGLAVLLRAFGALRREVPAELVLVGVTPEEVATAGAVAPGVTVLGRVEDAVKDAVLREADVLCAPSLGGESFGMVLTEAFAASTPVVASDIPGYREVVTHGADGLLFPAGEAGSLAAILRELALDPARAPRMGAAAGRTAARFGWPKVACEVLRAYEDARALAAPAGRGRRAAARPGVRPAPSRG